MERRQAAVSIAILRSYWASITRILYPRDRKYPLTRSQFSTLSFIALDSTLWKFLLCITLLGHFWKRTLSRFLGWLPAECFLLSKLSYSFSVGTFASKFPWNIVSFRIFDSSQSYVPKVTSQILSKSTSLILITSSLVTSGCYGLIPLGFLGSLLGLKDLLDAS